ncbi:hypothetical protein ACLKA7_013218 [Drosophila subpalustris]
MYVIYPADELILMTYGFFAPRVKPRPTLDCLPEPLVPLEYPVRANNNSHKNNNNNNTSANTANSCCNFISAAATSPINDAYSAQWSPGVTTAQSIAVPPRIPTSIAAPTPPNSPHKHLTPPVAAPLSNNFFNFEKPQFTALPALPAVPEVVPPQTPIRRTSRASLTHSNYNQSSGSKRSSVRSNRSTPLTPLLPHQRTLSTSMYNDASMQGGSSASGRAPFQRSSAYDEEADLTDYGASASGALPIDARSRSPSIFLEPPSPDPTHAHFGPGWGRPMSPMDLPPDLPRSTSSSVGNKSPTTKSRLRPKLHIPLGRLGRSASSETRERESNRLREDVHVHVENPVFSRENLRQNNFDAFFEAREPVIKVQPRTPGTAPADGRGYSPPLENYAGVYDSPRTKSPAGSSAGGLFARSPREERERAPNARSRSTEQWDEAGGSARAGAVGGKSSGGAAGGGAHSKGDRFFGKIFKWSKKS